MLGDGGPPDGSRQFCGVRFGGDACGSDGRIRSLTFFLGGVIRDVRNLNFTGS